MLISHFELIRSLSGGQFTNGISDSGSTHHGQSVSARQFADDSFAIACHALEFAAVYNRATNFDAPKLLLPEIDCCMVSNSGISMNAIGA
jgi:hypothetical protein